jgi:hypothetical protein
MNFATPTEELEDAAPNVSRQSQLPVTGGTRRGVAQPNRADNGPIAAAARDRRGNTILSICNFLSKGWEVGILGLLVFLQQRYALSFYLVGILTTVFIVSQISISFFAGRIAHAIQSRNVILLAITSSGLGWLTLFFARHIPALFLAYALAGIASGLFEPIGVSLIAKRSAANGRGKAIGDFAAFGDMGRIAVVAAATAMAGWFGVNNACAMLLVTNVAAFILAASFLVKKDRKAGQMTPPPRIHLSDLHSVPAGGKGHHAGQHAVFQCNFLWRVHGRATVPGADRRPVRRCEDADRLGDMHGGADPGADDGIGDCCNYGPAVPAWHLYPRHVSDHPCNGGGLAG